MRKDPALPGRSELASVGSHSRMALLTAFLFSVFVNLLMLTSPLYMLQIYDRVLLSRSGPTLVALSMLMAFLFIIMGVLDLARGRILARIGARFQQALDRRVLSASFQRLAAVPGAPEARPAQSDLEVIARFWASPLLQGLLDLPWTPLFIAALFIFHAALGWFAIAAALLLFALALANQASTGALTQRATLAGFAADREAGNLKAESELIRALGMSGNAFARWSRLRHHALCDAMDLAGRSGSYTVLTRTLRIFLQSAILGLGAWLVLQDSLSPGAMIAGSILLGRALQPIEVAIGQWPLLARVRAARDRLAILLSDVPQEKARMPLPLPRGQVEVSGLVVAPPGESRPVLRGVTFSVAPGQALGVIGLSGAGKSSLARALCGVWPPLAGMVRLDGAALDQYDPDTLGSYIGYLPQHVALFDGTIAANIARLDDEADPALIVDAAKKAAVHEMIVQLPQGYDTLVGSPGGQLSGGQIQRIGLARAFFGNPVMLVLDEPNSSLDNEGSLALNQAIRLARQAGCAVFIMAHRPAAIQECDLLLLLKDGMVQNFGPRDQVLREAVKNAGDIAGPLPPGPGTATASGQRRGP